MEGMIRVFINGTAFFVTDMNPHDLMAQRGTEVHGICDLQNAPANEAELRREIHRNFRVEVEYLNVLFGTPAATLAWYQEAA